MGKKGMKRALIFIIALVGLSATAGYAYTKYEKNNELEILKTKEELSLGYYQGDNADSVTENITVPLSLNGIPIRWVSSDTEVLIIEDNKAVIKTTENNRSVILTAVIQKGRKVAHKSFELTIKNEECLISFEGYDHFNFYTGKNQAINLPPPPEKDGYDFLYWSTEEGGEPIDTAEGLSESVILYPVFVAEVDVSYKVEHYYELHDGSYVLQETVNLTGAVDEIVTAEPILSDGYVKCDHLNSREQGTISKEGGLVLRVYYSLKTYQVKYELGLGEGNFPNVTYKHNALIARPSHVPTAPGRHFVRWSATENGPAYVFNEKITEDVVLYAVFDRNQYNVYFYNGATLFHTEEVFFGDNATRPLQNPTKEGYDFIGWDHNLENISGHTYVKAEYEIRKYVVKFYDFNNELLEEVLNVEHFSSVTPPTPPIVEGHKFDKWSVSTNNITGNLSVFAEYNKKGYAVIFYDHLGVPIGEPQTVLFEGEATPPQPPVKPNTQKYTYRFTGWSEETDVVTSDLYIYPEYEETINKYTYRFILKNETEPLKELTVPYGTVIVAPETPTKEQTAQYDYEFLGFEGFTEGMELTDNITFVGSFEAIEREYEVKYYVEGAFHSSEPVTYGHSANPPAVTKDSTISHVYELSGWSLEENGEVIELPAIVCNIAFYAIFDEFDQNYTIKFVDYDGRFLDEKAWDYGLEPSYDGLLTRAPETGCTYKHIGWSPEIGLVNKNQTYTAVYETIINTYPVRFFQDGVLLKSFDAVKHGSGVYYPYVPTKASTQQYDYIFSGWDQDYSEITKPMDIKAQFSTTTRKYTYEFVSNGTILSHGTIEYGLTVPHAKIPADPSNKPNHHFDKWMIGDDEYTPETTITGNVTINAHFEIDRFTITFKNHNGDVLQTLEEIAYGTMPNYSNAKPTKPATDKYTYTFSHWSPQIVLVTGDEEYIAEFSREINEYRITWFNHDGTETIDSQDVPYDELPVYGGALPTKPADAQYTYIFDGWTPAVVAVTGVASYTAKFRGETNKYSVTWNDYNGELLRTDLNILYSSTPFYGTNNPTRTSSVSTDYAFAGWSLTKGGDILEQLPTVSGNMIFFANYSESVRQYEATWVVDGQDNVTTNHDYDTQFNDDAVLKEKEEDSKYTYVFSGWSLKEDGDILEQLPIVLGDKTFYAIFNEIPKTYTLTYTVDGEVDGEVEEYDFGDEITPRPEPSKTGYTLSGWTVPETMPDHDVIVAGIFTINQYNLTYKVDGEVDGEVEEYDFGDEITPRPEPSKTGYTFSGWSEIPTHMPANDVEVVGTFTVNQYNLTYYVDGEVDGEVEEYDFGDEITPRPEPIKTGYTFSGWSEIPTNMPANDVEVVGTFTVNQYNLTYYVDGQVDGEVEEYDFGDEITPRPEPSKTGYTFSGWSEIPTHMPANDVEVVGTFTVNQYNLTYYVDGQVDGEVEEYDFGDEITPRPEPSRKGYTFSGWSEIPTNMPANDVEVTGTFTINQYDLNYVLNNGEDNIVISMDYNADIVAPNNPDKTGYSFDGWDIEIPAKMPAHDVTINAKWKINTYNIKFHLDNGDGFIQIFQDYNTAVTAPSGFEKVGHNFNGWSVDVPQTMPAYNMEITAKWLLKEYTITFVGIEPAPESQTIKYNHYATKPEYEPKAGYTQGWYEKYDENIHAEPITTLFDFENTPIDRDYTIEYFENVTIDEAFANAEAYFDDPNSQELLDSAWKKDVPSGEDSYTYAEFHIDSDNKEITVNIFDKSISLVEVLSGLDPVHNTDAFSSLVGVLTGSGSGSLAPGVAAIMNAVGQSGAKHFQIPIDENNLAYDLLSEFGGATIGGKLSGGILPIDDQMELNIVAAVFGKTVANLADAGYWQEVDDDGLPTGNPRAPRTDDLYALLACSFDIMTFGDYPIALYGDVNGAEVSIGELTTYFNKFEIAVSNETNVFDSSNEPISIKLFEVVTNLALVNNKPVAEETENLIDELSNITKVDMNARLKLSILVPESYKLVRVQIFAKDEQDLYTIEILPTEIEGDYYFKSNKDFKVEIEIRETYQVQFLDHLNVLIGEVQTVQHGKSATAPNDQYRAGYTFDGWDKEFDSVESDLTIKPIFTPIQYNINYHLDGGTNNTSNLSNFTVESPDIVLLDPTKSGFDFVGWYANANFTGEPITQIDANSIGHKDVYAKFDISQVVVSISGYDAPVTYGTGNVTLTANVEHAFASSAIYEWYKGDTLLIGKTTNQIQLTDVAHSGIYKVKVSITSENQTTTANSQVDIIINRAASEITVSDKIVTYNGQAHSIVAELNHEEAELEYINNGKVDADTYTVTVSVPQSDNYLAASKTATLTINKATYDMRGITFVDDDSKVYNGEIQTITINGDLPDDVSVRYLNNENKKAGTYKVTAVFDGDYNNYNNIPNMVAYLTINKATHGMNGVEFNDAIVTYNTEVQKIFISGSLPDGVTVVYSNNENKNHGTYEVTATFIFDYENYNPIPAKKANLTINQATATLTIHNKESVYGAQEVGLTATLSGMLGTDSITYELSKAPGTDVKVGGYAITADITVGNNNYDLTINNGVYTINPKPITVTATTESYTYGEAITLKYSAPGLVVGDQLTGALAIQNPVYAQDRLVVGEYAILQNGVTSENNPNYTITYEGGTLTINKAAATLTIHNKASVYGEGLVGLTATLSGMLGTDSITYELSKAPGQDVQVGGYAITANITADNGNYNLTVNDGVYTINPKAITVNATPRTITYGDAKPALGYTIVETLPYGQTELTGTLKVDLAHYNDNTYPDVNNNPGYKIVQDTLTNANNPNFTITYNFSYVVINPKAITVTATTESYTYGEAITLKYSAPGLVVGDQLTGVLAIQNPVYAQDRLVVGEYAILQNGVTSENNPNYTITYEGGTLTINKAAATLTIHNKASVYGEGLVGLTATLSGMLGTDSITYELSKAPGQDVQVGGYAITANITADNGNYNLTVNDGVYTINPKAITVTATTESYTYGEAITLKYSAPGLVVGDQLTGALAIQNPVYAQDRLVVGEYAILQNGVTSENNPNYAITYEGGTLTINKAPTKVVIDNKTSVYGSALENLTTQDPTVLFGNDTLDYSLSKAGTNDAGSYDITGNAVAEDNPNYAITFEKGTYTINPKAITVNATPRTITYGDAKPALGYTIVETLPYGQTELTGTLKVDLAHYNDNTYPNANNNPGYKIVQDTLTNANNPNFTITYNFSYVVINPKAITVTATTESYTYGEAITLKYSAPGLVGGDQLTGVLAIQNPVYAQDRLVVGEYAILQNGVTSENNPNYAITYEGGTLTINKAPTKVVIDNKTSVYGSALENLTTQDPTVLFGNDTLDYSLSKAGTNDAGSYDITGNAVAEDNPNYAITFEKGTYTINPKAITVNATPRTITYGDAKPALGYTIVETLPYGQTELTGTLKVDLAHYNDNTYPNANNNPGYKIVQDTLTNANNPNFTITYNFSYVVINPKAITVTATTESYTYGEAITLKYSAPGLVVGDQLTGALAIQNPVYAQDRLVVGEYAILQNGVTSENNPNYTITYEGGTLTINKAAATLTIHNKASVYGEGLVGLTATLSGMLGTDSITYELSKAPGQDVQVGGYAITANITADNGNYNLTVNDGVYTINPKAITVNATPRTITYGDAKPALGYTIVETLPYGQTELTGTLKVDLAHYNDNTYPDVNNNPGYKIVQDTLTNANNPNFTITYNFSYVVINPKAITVTATTESYTYGEAITLKYSAPGLVVGDQLTGALAIQNPVYAQDRLVVGEYAILQNGVTSENNPNYTITYEGGTLTINKAAATLTIHNKASVYGEGLVGLTATLSGMLGTDSITYELSKAPGQDVQVGGYAITANITADNGNYNLTVNDGVYTINPKAITVNATPRTITYGDAKPALGYTIVETLPYGQTELTGTLKVDLAHYNDNTYPDVNNNPGYKIVQDTLTNANNPNFTITYNFSYVVINPKAITVTATTESYTYGEAITLKYSAPGLVGGDQLTGALAIQNPVYAQDRLVVGEYAILQNGVTSANNPNYAITYEGGTLTINKAPTKVVIDNKTSVYGSALENLTTQDPTVLFGNDTLDYSLSKAGTNDAGSYDITGNAVAEDNPNYAITFEKGTYTITSKSNYRKCRPLEQLHMEMLNQH
ncbi:MAG: MBG domain-containing protein [Acholeplasmataceae bacterium]